MFRSFLFLPFLFVYSESITFGKKENIFDNSTIVVSLENYNLSNPDGDSIDSFHTLSPNSTSRIVLTKVPPDVHFVVLQVHSYLVNVTLSLDEVFNSYNSITGTNVGLVKIYKKTDLDFYVAYNSSSDDAEVMMTVQAYSSRAPIPGGCNMEFPVNISPFLVTTYNEVTTQVSFAPSAPALPPSQSSSSPNDECNSKSFPVQHFMYHQYFPERDFSKETYFKVLRSMMTKGRVLENGALVPDKLTGSPVRKIFASYPGTGNAFVVISHYEGQTSVYVPSFTYGCNDLKENNTCEVLTTTFAKVLCAIFLFQGLFTCYFGHIFFVKEIFVFGLLVSGTVSYILTSLLFNNSIALSSSVTVGLTTASLMVLFWTFFGLPIVSVILTTTASGFLLASIIFYPITDYVNLFVFDVNFWGIFIGIVFSCPILMIFLAEKANIISCSFLGSYIAVATIDHYIGSNLRYIFINTIRRAIDDSFKLAIIAPPYQLKDAILCATWAFLMLTGIKVQRLLMRNKPPYPPPVKFPFGIFSGNLPKFLSHKNEPSERTPLFNHQRTVRPDTFVGAI